MYFCVGAERIRSVGRIALREFPFNRRDRYVLNIIIVAIATVILFVYFRFSKHGYELSVVGESENTAKYVGINVKKVIIRTMVLSGVLCGLAGLLLVGGTSYTLSTKTVDGRGFTAILVAWLGKFSPFAMAFTIAALCVYRSRSKIRRYQRRRRRSVFRYNNGYILLPGNRMRIFHQL